MGPGDMGIDIAIEQRHHAATRFLRTVDDDWARAIDLVGPCTLAPDAIQEPYEALVRAIAYQQLTAKAGDAIVGRLLALYPGDPFPAPAQLLATDVERLRGCGFSYTKIQTIRGIAEGAVSGLVPPRDEAVAMDDAALIQRLVTLKGVGRWTVEMLLIFSLERPDVLPVDDFGVREGYRALKSLAEQPKPKALHAIGEAWAPHRTVASWYLWRVPRERGNVPA